MILVAKFSGVNIWVVVAFTIPRELVDLSFGKAYTK
jgi:hypothetical protein